MIPALLLLAGMAVSDPCGMVPPIGVTTGPGVLQRDGAQRTYVMHANGVETLALRPGFSGNVDEFGMLIPFPSVPEIRKIDDETFAHIEGAIEPPKMTVNVMEMMPVFTKSTSARFGGAVPSSIARESNLSYNQVAVLKEEAIGMYQVAVLQAGSPKALSRWMEDNEYQYPAGMDAVVADYVNESWCFVAVKAKVGGGPGVAPGPGLRSVNPDRPSGSSFDGFVQGMGFRFETKEPVVPMRLSVFNGEGPRNVVYMLTDKPVKIQDVPATLVQRQLSGEQLHRNLTQPIEQVFVGGDPKTVQNQLAALEPQRDPGLYNGVARDLFAGDLLALRTGQLSLAVEEEEKELLNISEALNLRGPQIDGLHGAFMETQRAIAVDGALDDIKEMHLSVIDGVLPSEILAGQNLRFEAYSAPAGTGKERRDPIAAVGPNVTLWMNQ
jgi:hypothetical protein